MPKTSNAVVRPSVKHRRTGDHINDRIARRLKLEAKTVSTAPVTEKHFHIKDAARILGISVWTLRHRVSRGECSYRRIGMRIFIAQSELDRIAGPVYGGNTAA